MVAAASPSLKVAAAGARAMKRTSILLAAAAFALGGLAGAYAWLPDHPSLRHTGAPERIWQEVRWPFPIDQWGRGKAFLCRAADCGSEVRLFLRAKIGFCDCATGVADDQELDRISDFALLGDQLTPLGSGRPIAVHGMKGRSRAYSFDGVAQGSRSVLSVGFNERCDALIATAVLMQAQPSALEPKVLEFLNSKTVLRWAEITLGL
jgi:hypothetical protein